MRNMTTDDVAKALNVEKLTAYKLVSFLAETEVIRAVGTKRQEGKKGKGATIYEIEDDLCQKLHVIGAKITGK